MSSEPNTTEPSSLVQWALVVAAALTAILVLQQHLGDSEQDPALTLVHDFGAQVLDAPAPDVEVVRADGSTVKLSSLRGKVVFINFWATWCPPCREEIPDLEGLAQLMRHLPFEILAVSQDDSWKEIQGLLGGQNTKMLVGLDVDKVWPARFGTEKLPETYVVDRAGRLRLRFINVQPWTDPRIHRYLEFLATRG